VMTKFQKINRKKRKENALLSPSFPRKHRFRKPISRGSMENAEAKHGPSSPAFARRAEGERTC
jgi:hypothetical protein